MIVGTAVVTIVYMDVNGDGSGWYMQDPQCLKQQETQRSEASISNARIRTFDLSIPTISDPMINATFPLLRSGACGGTGGFSFDPASAFASTTSSDAFEGTSTDPLGASSDNRSPIPLLSSAPAPATATSSRRSA